MADSEVRQKEWTILETERLIRKIEQCEGMPAKLILMRHFYEAGMRAGEIARWIPAVEEKLPEVGVKVLAITTPGRYVHVVKLDQSKEWRNNFDRNRPDKFYWLELLAVTHWQPLPAAPEEKKP